MTVRFPQLNREQVPLLFNFLALCEFVIFPEVHHTGQARSVQPICSHRCRMYREKKRSPFIFHVAEISSFLRRCTAFDCPELSQYPLDPSCCILGRWLPTSCLGGTRIKNVGRNKWHADQNPQGFQISRRRVATAPATCLSHPTEVNKAAVSYDSTRVAVELQLRD